MLLFELFLARAELNWNAVEGLVNVSAIELKINIELNEERFFEWLAGVCIEGLGFMCLCWTCLNDIFVSVLDTLIFSRKSKMVFVFSSESIASFFLRRDCMFVYNFMCCNSLFCGFFR